MNEVAISVIREYMDECLFKPAINWPKCEFNRRTYSRWAAAEILKRIEKNPEIDPIDILSQFANEVDDYSEVSDDRNTQFIFVAAREMAEELALLFV